MLHLRYSERRQFTDASKPLMATKLRPTATDRTYGLVAVSAERN